MLPSLPFSFYIIYTYIEHIYLLPTSTSHTHDIMSCTRLNPMCIVWRAKNSNKHGYRFTIMTQLNESKFIKFAYNFHVLIADVDSSRSSSSSKCACNIQPINVSFSDTHHTLKIETKYGKNAQSGFVRSLLLSIHPSIHPLFYFISILFVCFAYVWATFSNQLSGSDSSSSSSTVNSSHVSAQCQIHMRKQRATEERHIHIEKRWFWFFYSSWNVFYLENSPNVLSRRRGRTKEITTSKMRGEKKNKIK